MKVWLLRPVGYGPVHIGRYDAEERCPDLWNPWFDKAFGFVVRAATEGRARELAAQRGQAENPHYGSVADSPWLDRALTTCVELTSDGDEGVVIEDVQHA